MDHQDAFPDVSRASPTRGPEPLRNDREERTSKVNLEESLSRFDDLWGRRSSLS
jgi:hypothetical protein